MIVRWPEVRDGWRLSVGTLTAIPTRVPVRVDRACAGLAMMLAPLAVLPLGLGVVATIAVGHWLGLTAPVVALLAVGTVVLGNRAFHVDGLSDTADGLTASYDRERSLSVMKSGASGPAGTAAVVVVLGLQAAGLASLIGSLPWLPGAVLAGACVCVSRAVLVVCCMHGVRSARTGGLGEAHTETVSRPVAIVVWLISGMLLGVLAIWAGMPWWRGALACLVALVVVGLVLRRAVHRLGGVSGDVFGACIEVALAALWVALA